MTDAPDVTTLTWEQASAELDEIVDVPRVLRGRRRPARRATPARRGARRGARPTARRHAHPGRRAAAAPRARRGPRRSRDRRAPRGLNGDAVLPPVALGPVVRPRRRRRAPDGELRLRDRRRGRPARRSSSTPPTTWRGCSGCSMPTAWRASGRSRRTTTPTTSAARCSAPRSRGSPRCSSDLDVPVHVQADEAPWIARTTGVTTRWSATRTGDVVDVGGVAVELLHTPGHTPGSQCLLVERRLVTGDTLFLDGCGRTDLPGSDPAEMYETLTRRLAGSTTGPSCSPATSTRRSRRSRWGRPGRATSCSRRAPRTEWLAAFGR